MHRSRGVIHRSRGVCGEAEMGHQILLAPFVAVIGAFAATSEIPMIAVKHADSRHNEALPSQLQVKQPGLR